MNYLRNKSILFIGRKFFNYDKIIFDKLTKLGATVDYVPDVPFENNFLKAVLRVSRFFLINKSGELILQSISNFGRSHYDYIFCIIGEGLDSFSLQQLRSNFPKSKLILHLWDSIENNRIPLVVNFKYFDSVSSFDKSDSSRFNLQFRPLFFSDNYNIEAALVNSSFNKFVFDACFVGTAHSDRSKILFELKRKLNLLNLNIYSFQYLQAPWLYYIYNLLDRRYQNIPITEFSFESIPQIEVASIMRNSKVIIDIPHKKQSGLTIRTLECLGLGKKLATTNNSILDYDFYDENNIFIMDRNSPDIPLEFFNTDFNPIAAEIKNNYSLDSWIFDIFKPVL